jgi:hypothetical protein
MSLRSTYELWVKSNIPVKAAQLQGFLDDAGRPDTPIDETPDRDQDESRLQRNNDGKEFYLLLYDAHPETVLPALVNLSRHLGATFRVKEYIHEKTEMVDAGEFHHVIRAGVGRPIPAGFTEKELATVLAALRNWQEVLKYGIPIKFIEHFIKHQPLESAEVDELCQRLNEDGT